MRLKQQLGRNLKITFTVPSKNTREKEKEKNIDNYKVLWTKAETQKPKTKSHTNFKIVGLKCC